MDALDDQVTSGIIEFPVYQSLATMKKNIVTLFFLMAICACANAQNVMKKKIGFIPYTDPEFAEAEYRELAYKNIYDAALRVFVTTQRFDVLDRGSFNIVKIEKEFQKGDDLANSEIIAQGKIAAAELIAVAKLTTFTLTETDDGKGYSIYITAEFKQIDVETGKAINAFQLTSEIVDQQEKLGLANKKRISTPEEAISKAITKMEKGLEKWIKQNFPLTLKVIDIKPVEMSVVVEGGRDVGLNTNYNMKVIKIKMYPNGKKLTTSIGKLNFMKEGVGEDLTVFVFASKTDWLAFIEVWKSEPENIYVTEDL